MPLTIDRIMTLDSHWQSHKRYRCSDIPPDLCSWLLDPESLTLRLQQLCPDRFEVRVIAQQRGRPAHNEAQVLGMRRGSHALIRQVQLLCGGKPWIFARTVIPISSLRGRLKRLAHLGTRPLGGVLFADPGMRRGVVELACILPGQALYTAATAHLRQRPGAIWGRRSVFVINRKQLLVSEVFLPAFPAASTARRIWKSR
jgi:chorismate--pyruvate lyase